MKLKSLFCGIAAATACSFAAVQVYAVVDMKAEVANSEEIEAVVEKAEAIAKEMETGEPTEILQQIDAALEVVDEMLDEQPANEDELLDVRDGLVAMRIETAEVADSSDHPRTLVASDATVLPVGSYSGVSYGSYGGGGYVVSSGGGGAVASGGINIRRFWPLLGLIALAAIDGDDDDADPVSMPQA